MSIIDESVLSLSEDEKQQFYLKYGRELVEEKAKEKGRKLTACVNTFGCQMNARDSEKLRGMLIEMGFQETESEEADLVLYNTCTIRENANTRVYGRLGYLHNLKKKNPDMFIALCGCMMQEKEVVEKIRKSFSFVDLVFGTHNLFCFPELFCAAFTSKRIVIDTEERNGLIVENLPNKRKFDFKSGINITYGCNNFCSYCIVPYVRGREKDREPEDIINEIKGMVADGVVEIMLLGQNVNSYGKTLKNPISFAELLRRVDEIEGLKRIRFMTPHPKDFTDELIEVIRDSKKVCHHVHLPLQSGSSKILEDMNRRYTKEKYLQLAAKIRKEIPDVALTTDIIVGFPGETEDDFLETVDVVRQVKYDSAFTFIYSKRTGTKAARMENQIPPEVSKDRFDRLLAEVQKYAREQCSKYEGREAEVLVESLNEQDPSLVTGRLDNNSVVHFPGCESMIGTIVKVRLNEAKGFYYLGEMVDQ